MDTAIEVNDLVVQRGKRIVLPGFTCVIPRGSITGLLGPSGSGKTTLMRAVVGVQVVKSGTVTVLGEPAGSPPLRHKIGYLTQAPSVYADLTARENARYFASLYGLGKADADEALRAVGLEKAADQLVANTVRRPAQPRLARLRAGGQAGGARARRAHRRAGPGPARRAVGPVPRPRGRRHHRPGLQPRHGRGQPLRPAAAHPRRPT